MVAHVCISSCGFLSSILFYQSFYDLAESRIKGSFTFYVDRISEFYAYKIWWILFSKIFLIQTDSVHIAILFRFQSFLSNVPSDIHSCPKVYIQLIFRFTFSAAISKSLELKRAIELLFNSRDLEMAAENVNLKVSCM